MAKIPEGINGPITGTVGSVVGSSWKGIPYIKKAYKERTKKVSATELGNRNKFGEAQFWLQPILNFVREGFKGYTETVEGFLAAKSYLSKNAWEGTGADMRINPALVKVSWGKLPLSPDMAVEKTAEGYLRFSWSPEAVEGGSPLDQVMMLAYDVESKYTASAITGQFRSTGEDVLKLLMPKGSTYHIYMAFNAADRKSQSHSVYLGTIEN
jgi:hypothetical protein